MAHFFTELQRLRDHRTFVDVVFVVGLDGAEVEVPAHRCVIASFSEPLGAMLSGPMLEGNLLVRNLISV